MSDELNKDLQDIEEVVITILDKDGNPYDATILTMFQAGALERDYVAVLSSVPDENGNFPIQIFRYNLVENDGQEGIEISSLSSDMEFDEAREVLLTLIEDE